MHWCRIVPLLLLQWHQAGNKSAQTCTLKLCPVFDSACVLRFCLQRFDAFVSRGYLEGFQKNLQAYVGLTTSDIHLYQVRA